MKIRVRDIISYQGTDYEVEGLSTYKINEKIYPLARVVDGKDVRYLEPLLNDLDDRLLLLQEISDLSVATPPPQNILYKGQSYLPRLSGQAKVGFEGRVVDREGDTCELWRYRASGDLFIQVEKWPDRIVVLAGESVHKGMIDLLPGPG